MTCMYKTVAALMAGLLLFGLTLPVFAEHFTDPHFDKFPDCTTLDGFNANLDDSTGFAKECLANAHELNFHTDLIDDGSRLTLSEITDYCSQFGADATLEKNCIDDYMTAEENFASSLVILSAILFAILTVIVFYFCTKYASDYYFDAMPRNIVLRQKILICVGIVFAVIFVTLMAASEFIVSLVI